MAFIKYLYLAKVGPFYKIGCSQSLKRRMRNLKTQTNLPVKLILRKENCGHVPELLLHRKLRKHCIFGREWYEFDKVQLKRIKLLIKNAKEDKDS